VVTFQAYIDNIRETTGGTPEDFERLAEEDGVYAPDVKATDLVNWLGARFDLGRGHATAIWAVFMSHGWVEDPKAKTGSDPIVCGPYARHRG
jgi:hypothetical protein